MTQTCSLGVAHWDGRASAKELYEIADVALYRAKRAGRDRAEVATADVEADADRAA